jgi:hypothetical protein
MAIVELTTEQVITLVHQLSPADKRQVLVALAGESEFQRDARMALAEQRLRSLSAERGLDWETMSEDEREAFADDLVHEDRACAR